MIPIEIPYHLLPHAAAAPEYQTEGAAGADLTAAVPDDAPITLAPGGFALIPTGVALALPAGVEGQVRPRSGLAARHGVTLLNAPGTIDWDYRGEIQAVLINHGATPFEVTRGMRIAQLVVMPVLRANFRHVEILDATPRGAGGFGSTGAGAEPGGGGG